MTIPARNNQLDTAPERVRRAYLQAHRRWTGCDWPTTFGDSRLNLAGLTAAQAAVMAQATGGAEASDWWKAAQWLRQVEADADEAEQAAGSALDCLAVGDLPRAVVLARHACQIEARYHSALAWQALLRHLEAASGPG